MIFWVAAVTLCQAYYCDARKPFRSTTTVGTLVLFWGWWCYRLDDRDLVTGLRIDYGLTKNGSLAPTMLAHRVHGLRFDLGCSVAWPTSFGQFDEARLNGRVEARRTNFLLGRWRYPTLCAMVQSFCEFGLS